jgi:alpha-tubulin suppressor-like RCC1 family protein
MEVCFLDILNEKAAIDSKGNLIQFNLPDSALFPPDQNVDSDHAIHTTLSGGGLVSVAVSEKYVFGLSRNGTVFKTFKNQKSNISSSWFWSNIYKSPDYGVIPCQGLGWREYLVQISAGANLLVARSNKGRVFELDLENSDVIFEKGMIPKSGLEDIVVDSIQCGKNHVLALDNTGRVYGWGSNKFGVKHL